MLERGVVEYEAVKREVPDSHLDKNEIIMYPVDDETGPGTVQPLKGLPGSVESDMLGHPGDEHEDTFTWAQF